MLLNKYEQTKPETIACIRTILHETKIMFARKGIQIWWKEQQKKMHVGPRGQISMKQK